MDKKRKRERDSDQWFTLVSPCAWRQASLAFYFGIPFPMKQINGQGSEAGTPKIMWHTCIVFVTNNELTFSEFKR